MVPLVAEALAGDLRAERRSILSIEVVCEGEHDPYGEANGAGEGAACDKPDVNAKPSAATPPSVRKSGETEGAPWTPVPGRFGVNGRGLSGARQFFALNEAAITRGAMGRIIELTLNVSGVDVARMRGDGLVVSTATGSTAYALSAGGPLVSPGFKGMIARVKQAFPNAHMFATTLREVVSANEHLWGAILLDGDTWYVAQPRAIPVLDRIGGGDGFVGGLLYGVLKGFEAEKCLHFGWATGALATTVLTDYALPADEDQVMSIWAGNARVKR